MANPIPSMQTLDSHVLRGELLGSQFVNVLRKFGLDKMQHIWYNKANIYYIEPCIFGISLLSKED
jgi:hypothetical protein